MSPETPQAQSFARADGRAPDQLRSIRFQNHIAPHATGSTLIEWGSTRVICGVTVEETEDTLTVHGLGAEGVPGGATVASRLDHRIAMSFLCLGLAARAPVGVDDGGPIATSFPVFEPLMQGLGAAIRRAG